MEEKELNINELIKVESMPKIFSQLELIGKRVDKALKGIDKMECTDENKQEVKKRKQDITKFKILMEERRKEIKNQILEPYNLFNAKYDEEILTKLTNAEETLKEKYTKIEQEQKKVKEDELRCFVEEHCKANNIHVEFEAIGLNITLSASMKSLKEQAKTFIEKVASDLKLIEMEEFKDEILLEYQKGFDFVNAKTKVVEKHKQLEEIKTQREHRENIEQQEKHIEEKVDEAIEITAPTEIEEAETYQFEVKATKEQIKKLIEFMKELGVEYK